MWINKCVGCGVEAVIGRAPKGSRERRRWEAEREVYPVVCQVCNGGLERVEVALVREDGAVVAYSIPLDQYGYRKPQHVEAYQPKRLPIEVGRLYAKLVELGRYQIGDRCDLLGHAPVWTQDPEQGYIGQCRHCEYFQRGHEWYRRLTVEEKLARERRAQAESEARKTPEQREHEAILAAGGIVEHSSEEDRGYYSASEDDTIRHRTLVYRMPDGSTRQLTFNVGRD